MNIEPHHNNKTDITIITSGIRSGSGRSARKKNKLLSKFIDLLY